MNRQSLEYSTSGTAKFLGFAGLIPFVVPVLLMVEGTVSASGFQSAALFGLYAPYVFITYSAVILAFLCGALWGKMVSGECPDSANAVLIFSNLIALSAWASTLLIHSVPVMSVFAVALLMSGFLAVLFCERECQQMAQGSLPDEDSPAGDYWKMRVQLTLIVAFMHLVVIYLMIGEF